MLILPGEDPKEYEEIKNGWNAEYEPEGHMEKTLADNLILAQWMLKRAQRNRLNAEAEEDEHQLALAQRYLTTAERSFYRALNAMQGLRKDIMRVNEVLFRKEMMLLDEKAKNAKLERNQAPPAQAKVQKSNKKQDKIQIMDQWVEIEMVDGKTITTLYPSNEELWEEGKAMIPPPTLVYRRLNFVDGVPPEYLWTTNDPVTIEFGGMATQRIRLETWLALIEIEKASGTGHLQGCEIMPRPEERGGCDCESCTRAKARIAAQGR